MTIDRQQLIADLKNADLELTFTKADGTTRIMKATLRESALPPSPSTGDRKTNMEIVHVWDLDKAEWRSVRLDRLHEARKLVE